MPCNVRCLLFLPHSTQAVQGPKSASRALVPRQIPRKNTWGNMHRATTVRPPPTWW